MTILWHFDELGIPWKRNNLDKIKNGYWNKLPEFCKENSIFLYNGRVGEDQHEGRLTFKYSWLLFTVYTVSLLKCVKPETSDQPDRETCALKCHYL